MKKILFTAICISMIISHKVYGVDITIGATGWYAWGEQYNVQTGKVHNSLIESDPSLLYGPALSVKFSDDFNLTFVFLYGKFNAVQFNGYHEEEAEFKRIDSDLALNYRLNNYLKVFAGAKYLSYNIVPNNDSMDFMFKKIDPHSSYGIGAGVSATIPIMGNLFGLATLSGLYLFGKDSFVKTEDMWTSPPVLHSVSLAYNEYGFNTNISLAYYVSDISTVISLGWRFQYLLADYKDKNNDISLDYIRFIIHGVTLTATYNFSI
ncbi:MAG: hypothetical protein FWG49_04940 [Leptospirales bacterium]|nr:hypothetical protein [Leptospirales bacterium]